MRLPLLAAGLALLVVPPAFAQSPPPKRLPPIVFDVRGATVGMGIDQHTAEDLGIDAIAMPSRGFGGMVGIHVYPFRKPGFAIGFGGDGILSRARSPQSEPTDPAVIPAIERRMQGVSGALSLNFGGVNGWSYLTFGMGPLRFESFTGETAPEVAPAFVMTQNFGGGARWFTNQHIAFEFDVRFFLTRPQETLPFNAGADRQRVLVISAGIGIR